MFSDLIPPRALSKCKSTDSKSDSPATTAPKFIAPTHGKDALTKHYTWNVGIGLLSFVTFITFHWQKKTNTTKQGSRWSFDSQIVCQRDSLLWNKNGTGSVASKPNNKTLNIHEFTNVQFGQRGYWQITEESVLLSWNHSLTTVVNVHRKGYTWQVGQVSQENPWNFSSCLTCNTTHNSPPSQLAKLPLVCRTVKLGNLCQCRNNKKDINVF